MGKRIDITGKQFGRWHVVTQAEHKLYGKPAWECVCECGNVGVVAGSSLRTGESKSCGCLMREVAAENLRTAATTHGMHGTPMYYRWLSIKLRCFHKSHYAYPRYGGRGITMCERWRSSFTDFYADIGDPPSDAYSLDRIDNNGNYEPGNVRWATKREQANNRRNNVKHTYDGETHTLAEWGRKLGITPEAVTYRIKNGKPLL
jgi:hypothetical protein